MPWNSSDAPRFKKGLNPSQAKKWADIANGVLAQCQKDGGSDCEGKAIRVANSKFSEDKPMTFTEKIPSKALRLNETIKNQFSFDDSGKLLKMVAYSGKVIPNHWYWGNLVMDLNGMDFSSKEKYPILEDHQTNKKIGFARNLKVENNQLEIEPSSVTFLDTDEAKNFISNSGKGFPYEASIYAIPSRIEEIKEGEAIDVNGFSFEGPGKIWRKCKLKEVSVCVFGADSNTSSSVFADKTEEVELEKDEEVLIKFEEGETKMDLEKFKTDHPDLYKFIIDVAKKEEIDKFSAEIAKLNDTIKEQEKRILAFEKETEIRKEKEMALTARSIWTEKLSKSSVPEHLFVKVQRHVTYQEFTKDGILDETKFAEAVDKEIKDWEALGIPKVIGGSTGAGKDVDPEAKKFADTQKENEDRISNLLKFVGK